MYQFVITLCNLCFTSSFKAHFDCQCPISVTGLYDDFCTPYRLDIEKALGLSEIDVSIYDSGVDMATRYPLGVNCAPAIVRGHCFTVECSGNQMECIG